MNYGAIEAGGTKMICGTGDENGKIRKRMEIPTRTPEETMPEMVRFFRENNVDRIGIGAFGPIELNPESEAYGTVLHSPKTEWRGFSFYRFMKEQLGCEVVVDTDVNAAALGEQREGALRGISDGLYLTIGTGIGAGIIVGNRLVHGMLHPEAGHILVLRHSADDGACCCSCHSSCFEGLAAGPALMEKMGIEASRIPEEHPIWEIEAYYIAQALVDYTLVLGTKKIVLGGGVMKQEHLFPKIRRQYRILMGEYMNTPELQNLDTYIVPAELGGQQGLIGALALAMG